MMMVMLTFIVGRTVAFVMSLVVKMTGVRSPGTSGLSGFLVHLALKDQGSYPDRLDYRENERSNKSCDQCRKE
jgi:hypothetical protein